MNSQGPVGVTFIQPAWLILEALGTDSLQETFIYNNFLHPFYGVLPVLGKAGDKGEQER